MGDKRATGEDGSGLGVTQFPGSELLVPRQGLRDFSAGFDIVPISQDQKKAADLIRQVAKVMACDLEVLVPEGEGKVRALEKLRESVLWANWGIAHETVKP